MASLVSCFKITLRALAWSYLLLNLCIATIPRCDSILNVLQHSIQSELLTVSDHQHGQGSAPACHNSKQSLPTRIGFEHICACSLVKFVAITLSEFDARRYIAFHINSIRVLSFAAPQWNPAAIRAPEPPYPRDFQV